MTKTHTRFWVLLALLTLLWGCGTEPPPPGDEALQEVVQMLEETAEAVADERPYSGSELPDSPQECKPWWALNTGQRWGYMITIDLRDQADRDELVQKTYEFWREAGFHVRARTINTDPALHIDDEGYSYQLQVADDMSQLYLTGSTPCIPRVPQE
jgi:hypothetical protein